MRDMRSGLGETGGVQYQIRLKGQGSPLPKSPVFVPLSGLSIMIDNSS